MVADNITHLGPTGQPQRPEHGSGMVSKDPAFRRMLERLEELAGQSGAPKDWQTSSTDQFMDALKKADEDFITAMDLRRKLEEAYRRSQS